MSQVISEKLAYLIMLTTVVFWGFSWPAGSIVAHNLPPYFAAFLRYSIALPFFIIVAVIFDRGKNPSDTDFKSKKLHGKLMILGFLQVTLYNILFLSGLQFTSSSDATLIISSNPSITAVLASFLYRDEKLTKKRIFGLGLALSGVVLIILQSPNTSVSNRLLGDLIIFGAAFTWSTYSVLAKPIFKQIRPLTFTAIATSYAWLFLLITALIINPTYFSIQTIRLIDTNVFYALIFLALAAAVYGNIGFNLSVSIIGPSRTAIFVNMVPLIGVVTSILLLGDKFSPYYLISFLLIIIGIRIVNKK